MFWVFNKFELMQAENLMLKFWLFPRCLMQIKIIII